MIQLLWHVQLILQSKHVLVGMQPIWPHWLGTGIAIAQRPATTFLKNSTSQIHPFAWTVQINSSAVLM